MSATVTVEPQGGSVRSGARPGDVVAEVAVAAAVLPVDDLVARVTALLVESLPVDGCVVAPEPVAGGLAVPLVARGRTVGVLSLTSEAGPVRLSPRQRRELEGVAAVLASALRTARVEEQKGRLVHVAAALNAASSLAEVVARVRSAYCDLFDAESCAVSLLSSSVVPPSSGLDWVPEIARRPGAPVLYPTGSPDRAAEPSGDPSSPGSAVLFPLQGNEGLIGFVAVEPRAPGTPAADDLEAGQTLADLAAGAVARALLADRLRLRVHEAEALARLAEVVATSGGLTDAVRELNRVLPPELGIRVRSISLANAQLRATVGGRLPDACELEAVRSWRAVLGKGGRLRPRVVPGALLVPVVHRAKVLGVLRVAPAKPYDGGVEDLLLAIGSGCAELVHKAGLQQHLTESERRLAVAAERDRIAHDLHDSVGQLITGMGMRLAQYVADAPDKVWRARLEDLLQMAGRGNREVRQSIYALLFLDAKRGGLQASIRELCRKFEITTGMPVRFVVRGGAAPLVASKEDALFRVAHEALVNIERHARASLATVQLSYEAAAVSLTVRDDGVGLGHRDPFGRSGHFGIRAMQRRLEDAGGDLRVRNAEPRGVLVEAVIPRRKRNAHAAGTCGGHR